MSKLLTLCVGSIITLLLALPRLIGTGRGAATVVCSGATRDENTPVTIRAPTSTSTPKKTWTLRLIVAVLYVASAVILVILAFNGAIYATRTPANATLISDALLVLLVVIAIDGFDRKSITRDQTWLLRWLAIPVVVGIALTLLANMFLPTNTDDLVAIKAQGVEGEFKWTISGSPSPKVMTGLDGLLLNLPWALMLWVLIMALALTTTIAISRLRRH